MTGGNTGNQIIAYGLLKAIRHDEVSWDYSMGPKSANERYDVIVIAAANFLHSEFDLGGMASFIEATNLPCVMVGVGAQSNNYSTDIQLKPGTDRLMRVVSERTSLIGVRGVFTAEVLARMGITNVQITGCPSYYMNCKPDLPVRKPPLSAQSRLLINSSRDVVSHSFDRDKMIKVVCQLLSIGLDRKADFVAQSEVPEIAIADTSDLAQINVHLKSLLQQFPFYKSVAPFEDLAAWFSKHACVYWDVARWYEEMSKYDFVFGNRFHGNLIAIQAGTAACVVCHDTRTTEMSEYLGLPSIGMAEIDDVDVNSLYERVDPDAIQSRYSQLYPAYRDFLISNGLDATLE